MIEYLGTILGGIFGTIISFLIIFALKNEIKKSNLYHNFKVELLYNQEIIKSNQVFVGIKKDALNEVYKNTKLFSNTLILGSLNVAYSSISNYIESYQNSKSSIHSELQQRFPDAQEIVMNFNPELILKSNYEDKHSQDFEGINVTIPIVMLILILSVLSLKYTFENHYTILTALSFTVATITGIIFPIIGLKYFGKIEFYKYGKLKNLVGFNGLSIFSLFAIYLILIQFLSLFSFIAFEAFITEKIKTFHPETLLFVVPSLFGLFLLAYRKIPSNYPIKDSYLNDLKDIPIINQAIKYDEYLLSIKDTLFSILVTFLVIGFIGLFIFSLSFSEFTDISSTKISKISLIYAIIFSLFDSFVSFMSSKNEITLDIFGSTNNVPIEIQKPFMPNRPKLKKFIITSGKLLLLVIIAIMVFGVFKFGSEYYKNKDLPVIEKKINITGYTIFFEVGKSPMGQEIMSEKIRTLNNQSLEYSTPIVEINKVDYPMSTKINELLNKKIIKASRTGKYLNKKIRTTDLEITFKAKNNSAFNQPDNTYYFTTEYDDYIFLELYNGGYGDISSIALDTAPNSPTIHFFHKLMYSESANGNIAMYMDFTQDGLFEMKELILASNNTKLINDKKEEIKSFHSDVSIVTLNESLNKEDFFVFTYK